MTNLKRVIFGAGFWLIGLIVMYIINLSVPLIINTLEDTLAIDDTGSLRAFVWLGIVILYVLMVLVYPLYNIIEGLKEGEQGKFSYILTGIIFWIFAMGFVYVQYGYLTSMAAIIATDTVTKAIFWGSTILIWGMILIGVPGFMIIKGYEKGETTE